MLSTIFTTAFGTSGGPEVGLFNRFQKQWPAINKGVFTIGNEELFNCDFLIKLYEEMLVYYCEAIKGKKPRVDYLELLHLCLIFLGRSTTTSELNVKIMAPGTTHNARWMAKAIYCLKYICFRINLLLLQGKKRNYRHKSFCGIYIWTVLE